MPDPSAGSPLEGIVVLGMPRSGTTLVRRILGAHPEVHAPPETGLLSAAARFLQETEFGDGVEFGVLSGLAFSGFEEDETLRRLREFVFGFHREMAKAGGCPRWLEKTAFDAFHIPAVRQLCDGHCHYVLVVRDPLDVVDSVKELVDRMEVAVPELQRYRAGTGSDHEAYARAWADVVRDQLRLAEERSDETVWVRYEDLVASPEAEIGRLLRSLELPGDASALLSQGLKEPEATGFGDWKAFFKTRIDASSVGRGGQLSEATRRRVMEATGSLAETFGYRASQSGPRKGREESRRRYELELRAGLLRDPQ